MTILIALLSVTIYSAVIYAAILLFRLVFKKHVSPLMMYAVWFLLIARFMIPVTLDSGISLITIPATQNTAQTQMTQDTPSAGNSAASLHPVGYDLAAETTHTGYTQQGTMPQSPVPALSGSIIEPQESQETFWDNLNLPGVLIVVWIIGMLPVLSQTIAASIKLKKRLLRDSVPAPDEWLDTAGKIKAEFNIRGRVHVKAVKDLASPALTVSLYPNVLMPAQPAEDTEKIEFALRHEMMHLKRKDHIVCILLVILRIIYWFNPVIWLASKQIKADMETACDSAAVSPLNLEKKKRYAATVLDMYALGKVRFALGMSLGGTRKSAERRIRGIFMRKRSSSYARAAAVMMAAAMLIACFTTACQPIQENPSTSASNLPTEVTASPTPGISWSEQSVEPTVTATSSQTLAPTASPAASQTLPPTLSQASTPKPIASLPAGVKKEASFNEDLDGDGRDETIAVGSVKNSYEIRLYVLYAGGYKKAVIDEGTFQSAYLTHTAARDICLLVSIDEASEDYVTFTFSFSGTNPVPHDDADGYARKVSGTRVTLSGHGDAIGTWDYTCKFKINNNFTLAKTSDYTIVLNWMQPLHTIRELPVEMLADGAYTAGTLPAGTNVTPLMTDWNSYMTFKLEDGSAGRFHFTRGENAEAYIDGIIESEYFDNIEYSD